LLEVIREVAALLRTRPKGTKVLIVYRLPKTRHMVDFKGELLKEMTREDMTGVSFMTWGKHTGTNDFQDYDWEIQIGALMPPASASEAQARGAKRISTSQPLPAEDFERIRIGTAEHNIFQAAGRIAIRKSQGDGCPSNLRLYTVFSNHRTKGIPEESLSKLFPGSKADKWATAPKPKRERKKLTQDEMERKRFQNVERQRRYRANQKHKPTTQYPVQLPF
jgi:hypothetical protein